MKLNKKQNEMKMIDFDCMIFSLMDIIDSITMEKPIIASS